jgi:hypothetical protein
MAPEGAIFVDVSILSWPVALDAFVPIATNTVATQSPCLGCLRRRLHL